MKLANAVACVAICALFGAGCAFQSPNTADVRPLFDVTHLTIKGYSPRSDGVNWLHGVALCWHDGRLYASFGVNAVAAKGKAGSLALLVTRSVSGADALGTIPVRLSVAGRSLANARLHVTDELERYTERTLRVATDGTATIRLRPHAFAVVELP